MCYIAIVTAMIFSMHVASQLYRDYQKVMVAPIDSEEGLTSAWRMEILPVTSVVFNEEQPC